MGSETMELGQSISGISLGEDVGGEPIAGLKGARVGTVSEAREPGLDGDDEGELAAAAPLGPEWFLFSEPLRRYLAKRPSTTHHLVERFDANGTLAVNVEPLLRALEVAGLVYQRKHVAASGAVEVGKWTLTETGHRAARWAGPELGALDRCGYAREMASALGRTLGLNVHDIYRGPTYGVAVFARARFCAALNSIGWRAADIARHFAMDPAWVEQGIERWKRVHMALEPSPSASPAPVGRATASTRARATSIA